MGKQGQFEQARRYLQQAISLRADYADAINNLGVLYLNTQRRDQAVASFEECIRVAPAFDQAYLNLARVYALEGAEKAYARFELRHTAYHEGWLPD